MASVAGPSSASEPLAQTSELVQGSSARRGRAGDADRDRGRIDRSRSRSPPRQDLRPLPPRDILLALTAFDMDGTQQLCGPAMVKTKAAHTMARVLATFCRWSGLNPEQVGLHDGHGIHLPTEQTVHAAGLANGSAVSVILLAGALPPGANACAQRFAMLDVLDSELAAISDGLQM